MALVPGATCDGTAKACAGFLSVRWDACRFYVCQEFGETVFNAPRTVCDPAALRGLRLVFLVQGPGEWQIRHTFILFLWGSNYVVPGDDYPAQIQILTGPALKTGTLCPDRSGVRFPTETFFYSLYNIQKLELVTVPGADTWSAPPAKSHVRGL